MRKNEDLLKDTPETGEEQYTENMEKTVHACGCKGKGIRILKKEAKDEQSGVKP